MKATIIILLIGAISLGYSEKRNELTTRLKLKYLEAYLQERQNLNDLSMNIEKVCPGTKLKIEDAIGELKTCADEIDETAETSCSIIQNKSPKCIEPVLKVLRECLPEESKGLPDFVMKSVLKTVDYICKTDGEHIFELGNTCLYKQNPITFTCKRKLFMKLQTHQQQNGIGVRDICSLMQNLRPCLKSHLSLSCGSSITQEAFIGVYDAFLSNCKNTEDDIYVTPTELGENIDENRLEDLS